jgi:hypothetical protein
LLSNRNKAIEFNSNGAGVIHNLIEALKWGTACIGPAGFIWTMASLNFCSDEDLASAFPISCMAKVGASSGAAFGANLALNSVIKHLLYKAVGAEDTVRPLSWKNLIQDSVLFASVVGFGDAGFMLTSTASPFNYLPYSSSGEFSANATLRQSALSGASVIPFALLNLLLLRGLLLATMAIYENRNQLGQAAASYAKHLSVNSQCSIL